MVKDINAASTSLIAPAFANDNQGPVNSIKPLEQDSLSNEDRVDKLKQKLIKGAPKKQNPLDFDGLKTNHEL